MGFQDVVKRFLGFKDSLYLKKITGKLNPNVVRIEINAGCNAQCPFCPRTVLPEKRKKGFMDMDLYHYTLTEVKKIGISKAKLYVTGEPSLHPEFSQIVDTAKKKGFTLYLSTNASFLNKCADTFLKADYLQLSLEGWDRQSYEKNRPPLKFNEIYENIKNYSKKYTNTKQICSIHVPTTKETELESFINLWGTFVDRINIDIMQPMTFTNPNTKLKGENINESYYKFKKMSSRFMCYFPFTEITVGHDGKILLCCQDFHANVDLGDINEGITAVIKNKNLKNIQAQFFRQKIDYCFDCCQFYLADIDDIKNLWKKIFVLKKKNLCTAKLELVSPHRSKAEYMN